MFGKDAYTSQAARWNEFRNWIRFNILPLRVPRIPGKRAFYREQRELMINQARQAIEARCERPLSETKLHHLVILAISEIRRGRHPGIKVRTLLAESPKAQDFLFSFIRKRVPNLSVKYQYMTVWEQKAERADKFRAALQLPVAQESELAAPDLAVELEAISEAEVTALLAKYFEDYIPRDIWDRVKNQVDFMSSSSRLSTERIPQTTLQELLQQFKPGPSADVPDEINDIVERLLGFLFTINASPARAARLVHGGWGLAMKRNPILTFEAGTIK